MDSFSISLIQKYNRCYGDGHSLIDHKWDRLGSTGTEFLTKISANDEDCVVYFKWNQDKSIARISNYWRSSLAGPKFAEEAVSGLLDEKFKFTIELAPYWKWKFGLKIWNPFLKMEASKLDKKCCPPKDETKQCMGPKKLGKEGPCETISMACGDVKEEDVVDCKMYTRVTEWFGDKIPYYVYALYDKYGNETPYNKVVAAAFEKNGVDTLFHGIERVVTAEE